MDLSAILTYKFLFFLNRANNTKNQADNSQKCSATANAVRCAITLSQSVVPLYGVSNCLAKTAKDTTVKNIAKKVSESNLQKIATEMTASTTKNAISSIGSISKTLAKLGVVGNLSYAAAKCMDAKEEDKNKVFAQAGGNCAGMYLCEYLYSKSIEKIDPKSITDSVEKISKLIPKKMKILKSVKPMSLLYGVGFVIASISGCRVGEKVGEILYNSSNSSSGLKLQPAYAGNNQNINTIA